MNEPHFREDTSDVTQIRAHLEACDASFIPRLSGRVHLADYARKIATKAHRFEAWEGGELVGLVAAYCNASDRRRAFITSVSVSPRAQGEGLASQLVARCIAASRRAGFDSLELEVGTENARAMALYRKHGFGVVSENGGMAKMAIELDGMNP